MANNERFFLGLTIGISVGLAFGGILEFLCAFAPGAGFGIGIVLDAGFGAAFGLVLNRELKNNRLIAL